MSAVVAEGKRQQREVVGDEDRRRLSGEAAEPTNAIVKPKQKRRVGGRILRHVAAAFLRQKFNEKLRGGSARLERKIALDDTLDFLLLAIIGEKAEQRADDHRPIAHYCKQREREPLHARRLVTVASARTRSDAPSRPRALALEKHRATRARAYDRDKV